jgi:hypothetical protein
MEQKTSSYFNEIQSKVKSFVDSEKIRDSSNGLSLKERKGWNE